MVSTASDTDSVSSTAARRDRFFTIAAIVCAAFGGCLWIMHQPAASGILLIVSWVLGAMRLQYSTNWQPFAFSFWVLAFVTAAFAFPIAFTQWGSAKASDYVGPLIQLIMFGMGTTLSVQDFARVLVRPKAVFIGMVLQFSVMPLAGWVLTKVFFFPPEIAAGVILIGACPGGVASNVITYLARGDVALSVTMTACSTLMAPLMTPLMMRLLGGELITVSMTDMMWSIINMVIVPTVGGLIANWLLVALGIRGPWVDQILSVTAMLAICVVIGIIVAQARDQLISVGPLIVLCAMLHNGIGYYLGYMASKRLGLSESECRTISIEVGMQNGGMGSGLALKVLHSPQAALAPAVFGAWMSIAGSILASYWRKSVDGVESSQTIDPTQSK